MKKFAKVQAAGRTYDSVGRSAPVVAKKETAEQPPQKSNPGAPAKKSNFHYPARTEGGKHARELRERTNTLGETERADLYERAMRRIYGNRVKATVGSGH
jgi:hypothetical protein